MIPSDVLSGFLPAPLTYNELQVLFVAECLARGRLQEANVLHDFATFEVDPARIDKASRALDAAKRTWTENG